MATPSNAKELFDTLIPAALQKHPEKAKEVNAVYFFDIAGDGGGQWTVDLTATPPNVSQGDAGNAQCSIQCEHEDFMSMLKDPAVGMQLYFQGKLTVTGDPMLATQLQELFNFGAEN